MSKEVRIPAYSNTENGNVKIVSFTSRMATKIDNEINYNHAKYRKFIPDSRNLKTIIGNQIKSIKEHFLKHSRSTLLTLLTTSYDVTLHN